MIDGSFAVVDFIDNPQSHVRRLDLNHGNLKWCYLVAGPVHHVGRLEHNSRVVSMSMRASAILCSQTDCSEMRLSKATRDCSLRTIF